MVAKRGTVIRRASIALSSAAVGRIRLAFAWALDRNRYLELLTWAAVTGPMGVHVLITRKISKRRSIASEGCKRSSSEERLCSAWQ